MQPGWDKWNALKGNEGPLNTPVLFFFKSDAPKLVK